MWPKGLLAMVARRKIPPGRCELVACFAAEISPRIREIFKQPAPTGMTPGERARRPAK